MFCFLNVWNFVNWSYVVEVIVSPLEGTSGVPEHQEGLLHVACDLDVLPCLTSHLSGL